MSAVFRTPITRLLGIRTPVISATMTGPSGGLLAAAVTKAGGFGFLSAGRAPSVEDITHQIDIVRQSISNTSDTNFSHLVQNHRGSDGNEKVMQNDQPGPAPLPIGVGFFGFELDTKPHMVEILDLVMQQRARAIWLSFGTDLGKWVQYIRDSERARNRERSIIFVQLPTAPEAQKANSDWDIDVIVLQGNGAGGHSFDTAPPIISLLPEALKSVTLPILAAGGLVSGGHLASMLALGAAGIVVGTRFSVASESLLPQGKKERLIATQPSGKPLTYVSPIYDELLGATSWPIGTTARGLRMEEMIKDKADGASIEERRRAFEANNHIGGTHEIVWAGTGVGLINKIQPAGEIVREIHEEALQVIRATSALIE